MTIKFLFVSALVVVACTYVNAFLSPVQKSIPTAFTAYLAKNMKIVDETSPMIKRMHSKLRVHAAKPTRVSFESQPHKEACLAHGESKDHLLEKYWFDQRIHSLGNIGISGGFHASIALLVTKHIDNVSYDGLDMRLMAAKELSSKVKAQKARVLDMCCGVGISTRALRQGFPNAKQIMGLDTSPQMVAMAKFLTDHLKRWRTWIRAVCAVPEHVYATFYKRGRNELLKGGENQKDNEGSPTIPTGSTRGGTPLPNLTFINANAEDTKLPSKSFDLITIMYAFHEVPRNGRFNMMREAHRLLSPGGVLAIVDLTTDYKPSKYMLAGEPYVLEYQQNIHRQLKSMKGFEFQGYKTMVPGHVGMWTLRRQTI